MRQNAGNMLGISISLDSKKKILEDVEKYLFAGIGTKTRQGRKTRDPLVIVTPNPEQIVLAASDTHFADILNRADVAVPDGIGVIWASRVLGWGEEKTDGDRKIQRIPGIELFEDLVALAGKKRIRIGLIGGLGDLAVKALECLQARHQNLKGDTNPAPKLMVEGHSLKLLGAGHEKTKNSPSVLAYVSHVVSWIKDNDIAMVFVGLGAPKQEYLIEELVKKWEKEKIENPVVLMAVGGSYDIITGKFSRAPLLMRLIGFEWLWRLIREPWRLRRQLALFSFSWMVLKKRFVTK
jgi:N-acetylglucosaminyldiphosphoundecaprenol N-acetyl-beta-D-mannosaminyltransferase